LREADRALQFVSARQSLVSLLYAASLLAMRPFHLVTLAGAFTLLWFAHAIHTKPSFDSAQLVIDSSQINTPLEFNITFRTTRIVGVNEVIVVRLPRFTKGLAENSTAQNETYGNVMIAPSYNFVAKWLSGYNSYDDNLLPHHTAELHIMPLYNVTFAKQAQYTITVFKENGIGAVCGFPSSETVNATGQFTYPFKAFEILTAMALEAPTTMPTEAPTMPTEAPTAEPTAVDPTAAPTSYIPTAPPTYAPTVQHLFYHNDSFKFDFYTGVGKGCKNLQLCTKQGQCDYCHEKCYCFDGFGSATDLISTGRDIQPDCSSSKCFCVYAVLVLCLSAYCSRHGTIIV
jgi:hypothetical protein